ncbi:hypothetical protein AFLA_012660 [Aspergillus flavus NRRL3357]|nr:hypothetical protein AFLA_012660 [Aspergillus flavus NRRL3357]
MYNVTDVVSKSKVRTNKTYHWQFAKVTLTTSLTNRGCFRTTLAQSQMVPYASAPASNNCVPAVVRFAAVITPIKNSRVSGSSSISARP